jgi:serine protease Do
VVDNLVPGGGLGGGPLINSNGEVIGLLTAILGRDGYGQNAAAIMAALHNARPVIEALATKGSVDRSQIGVSLNCANRVCEIFVVFPASNAAAAGLAKGDVIKHIDGRAFVSANAIMAYIGSRPIGATLQVAIERDGAPLSLPVVTASTAVVEPGALPAPPKE